MVSRIINGPSCDALLGCRSGHPASVAVTLHFGFEFTRSMSPSVTHRQKKAPPVTDGAEWRRRESNPRVSSRKWRDLQALVDRELEVAALALHSDGPDWHSLSPGTLELAELITCWPQLPEPIRQIILTLVRSVKMSEQDVIDSAELNRAGKRVIIP